MDLDEENNEQNPNKYSLNNKYNTDNPNNNPHYNYSIINPKFQKQPTKLQYSIANGNNNTKEENIFNYKRK